MIIIKIGKAEDNDYIIDDPHISRYHALLKIITEEESFLLEDLNSGNGTFVNGQQILRKKVILTDKISFGAKFETNLSEILLSKNNYSIEFEKLKITYDNYQKSKVKIQSSNQFKTRLLQSLPFTLPGIIGIVLGITGNASNTIIYTSLFIAILAPVCGIILGAKQAAKIPEQLQILNDKFKTDYICPKCKSFLGEIPWKSLKNRGKCINPSCKASW